MAEKKDDNKIDIPVVRTDLVLFDDAKSLVREKFIAEMQRMDEEMNKLSLELMRMHAQPSTFYSDLPTRNETLEKQSPSKGQDNWEPITRSPLVEVKGENKILKLQFDVSKFDPTEVTVKVHNEMLVVSASHEEESDSRSVLRQFYKEFKFPKGLDPSAINSTLSKDGVLTIQAPLPQLAIADKTTESVPKELELK